MKSSAKVNESPAKRSLTKSKRGSAKSNQGLTKARVGEGLSRPRIGFHAPIGGGLQSALLKAQSLGAETVQIFSRNPRGWKARPLDAEEVENFMRLRRETGISPVVIHANYLINLAAADAGVREKSVASFREEVERGQLLGADYLVVHPGSARGACEADGLRTCAESLNAACEGLELGAFRILLENTAGQGQCIGHRFEHLREIAERCPGLNLGVCLDTAHAFTAGYDIREEDGLAAALDSLDRNVGLAEVRAVHFNDSKAVYNSRVDRHWHLGLGHIGAAALRRVARDPRLSHAAFLLETPQDELGDDARNLALLRSFVEHESLTAVDRS
ncbi:MAG TPA: deoxyribonuclease IV [Pyrinomonadaceae bacterium]|jgi:deoxyribonuclease-4|nr:deoxyribonuclease IV [Pyrinomonadaceae bacterium]